MKRVLVILCFVIFSCDQDEPGKNMPPTPFTVSMHEIKPTSAQVSWTESKDPEDGEIKYNLYLEGALLLGGTTSLNHELNGLLPNKHYEGKVIATDSENNQTESTISFSTTDPQPPTTFKVEVKTITETSAGLQWEASSDPEGGLVKYSIYLEQDLVAEDLTALEYSINGLTMAKKYSGKIVARNSYGKTTEALFSFYTLADLKAHYDFCGNTNDQTGINNGTIVGSVTLTQDRKGNENCAYQFPGTANDYIEIPYSGDFNISTEGSFSISLWYQGYSNDGGDLEYFVVKENALVEPLGTDYHLGLYDCNNPSFGSQYSPVAFAVINECNDGPVDMTWRHIVATYNNKKWTIYVDNVLKDSKVSDIGIFQSSNGIKVGKFYKGKLDDVMFFSRELTAQDVDALFKL